MDPVVAGAVVTVLVSVVSGAVKIAYRWLGTEVELARIADEGATARVRYAVPRGAMQESVKDRRIWFAPESHGPGGGCDGGCRQL
ncbi:hypothetical protein [Streptomyces kanasensis]|uniref:Uncharacterized protein n=1 Tax=Streptomyces kanasensis TaxID=936756 RepID=A0A117IUF5_9ACTN|nr:hypothetical protein [Streptomyces kanasensis]KUH35795.1 hypothetical protein ATE80_27140 [Streptomyces kanasensis]